MSRDLPDVIRMLGGAAKTVELLDAGFTARELARARGAGIILRPRKAWYVLPNTPHAALEAVRVGGRATCVTALGMHGAWVSVPDARIHVAVHRSACQLRSTRDRRVRQTVSRDAVVHWRDTERPRRARVSRLVEPPDRVALDLLDCLDGEALLASIESMLHLGILDDADWSTLVATMPAARRRDLAAASSASGSGIETYFVARMRRLGIAVFQQVWIGSDRVDVLIGHRLVVELDGRAFHDPHRDYERDARLVLADRRVLHFDYHQVMDDWPTVEAVVLASLRRGDHL